MSLRLLLTPSSLHLLQYLLYPSPTPSSPLPPLPLTHPSHTWIVFEFDVLPPETSTVVGDAEEAVDVDGQIGGRRSVRRKRQRQEDEDAPQQLVNAAAET